MVYSYYRHYSYYMYYSHYHKNTMGARWPPWCMILSVDIGVGGIGLDELAARLHVVAHEH
jgi:hypothetical protein